MHRHAKEMDWPVGYFKFQTTADSPGSGFTCASLNATASPLGPTFGALGLGGGWATDIALGAMAAYDLGPAKLQVYAADSVYAQDDFKGWSLFTRLSFKFFGDEPLLPRS